MIVTILTVAILIALFLAAQTDKARSEPICPDGSTIAYDTTQGFYPLYSPDPPGAYTRIILIWEDHMQVVDNPPLATYQAPHIVVCYNDNAIPEFVDGCDGFTMGDGTCMTIARYNETFSVDALEEVESLTQPGRSVADVYHLRGTAPLEAADRPRNNGLLSEPTVREIIEGRLWML